SAAQRGGPGVVPVSPARDRAQWRALLGDHGFHALVAIADTPELESASQLLLAGAGGRARAHAAARRFALLCDERGAGAELAARLAAWLAERQQDVALVRTLEELRDSDVLVDLA